MWGSAHYSLEPPLHITSEHVLELGKLALDCLIISELDMGRVCHCIGEPSVCTIRRLLLLPTETGPGCKCAHMPQPRQRRRMHCAALVRQQPPRLPASRGTRQ